MCNNSLSLIAGSETAVFSMAVELQKRGHTVTAFSFNLGVVSDKLKKLGIECVDNLAGRRRDFDVAICNHFDPTNYVKANCPNIPIISTIHGIIGGPETPPLYADAFVAVSEEVQALLKTKYEVDSTIIRNGVDLERFKENNPRGLKLKTALLSSSYVNRGNETFKKIYDACRIMNIELHATGKDFAWVWNIEEIYQKVDLVFTLGRGCLEAMSCNRAAMVVGHWGRNQELSADGMVTFDNYEEIRKNNFSSRRFRKDWGTKDIVNELSKYNGLDNYRPLIEANHDIRKTADQYISLAETIRK